MKMALIGICIAVCLLCGNAVHVVGESMAAQSSSEVWTDFWQEWTTSRYYPKMYPFGIAKYNLDNLIKMSESLGGVNPQINFTIPFYGKIYDSAVISVYGYIAFPHQLGFFSGTTWPNPHYPGMPDPAFASPFYGEVTLVPGREGTFELGTVWWGVLDERLFSSIDAQTIVRGLLDKMSHQVRTAVVGAEHFTAKYGLMATWRDVTFAGPPCTDKCPRNTFQAVILTDEIETHVIYNYYNVTWVGSAVSQLCDPQTGKRSQKYPACQPSNAGFNAGNGRGFTHLPFSHDHTIDQLDIASGSDVTGRFIYKVNDEVIVRGGCSNAESGEHNMFYTEADRWPLQIYPREGGMLGGDVISLSGPCFFQWHDIKCEFGNEVVDGVFDDNIMKAYCVAPLLSQTGPVKLRVSTDSGMTYKYSAIYTVVQLENTSPAVRFLNNTESWAGYDAEHLSLMWEPQLFSNTTQADSTRVDILLYGYREENQNGLKPIWKELHTLETNYPNIGHYEFQPSEHSCTADDCHLWQAGVIQVRMTGNPTTLNRRLLWSYIIPLGWYVNNELTRTHGKDWPAVKCEEWYKETQGQTEWLRNVPPCPCTLGQAYSDFGKWEPDPLCNMHNLTKLNCRFHQGAKHCVRLVQTGARGCSGNLCCFDYAHNLMYSADTAQGSFSEKRHRGGFCRYQSTPYLSHFITDIVPHLHCCRWSSRLCYLFAEQRPTKDCKAYKSPGYAIVYGDPHFRTFDGTDFTFNGRGEFWFLKIVSRGANPPLFKLQGRMEQLSTMPGVDQKATVLTSVVMEQNTVNRPKVQIQVSDANTTRELLVMVDFQIYHFDTKQTRIRYFGLGDSVQIINNSPRERQHSNFTVIFRRGMAVQVASQGYYLHVVVQLPENVKGKTSGLLGTWDDDRGNDFKPRDGASSLTSAGMQEIHEKFGLSWMVKYEDSLFWYSPGKSWNYFIRPSFIPSFDLPEIPEGSSFSEHDVNVACGHEDFPCQYDYRSSGDREMAMNTKHIQGWFALVTEEIAKPVNTCGLLPVQHAIRQASNGYLIGSVVALQGCQCDCTLTGHTRYECILLADGSGEWSPQIDAACVPNEQVSASQSRLATAVAVPVVLVLVGGAVAVAAFMLIRTAKENKRRYNVRRQTLQDGIIEEDKMDSVPSDSKTEPILKTTIMQSAVPGFTVDTNELKSALEKQTKVKNGSLTNDSEEIDIDTKDATETVKLDSKTDTDV